MIILTNVTPLTWPTYLLSGICSPSPPLLSLPLICCYLLSLSLLSLPLAPCYLSLSFPVFLQLLLPYCLPPNVPPVLISIFCLPRSLLSYLPASSPLSQLLSLSSHHLLPLHCISLSPPSLLHATFSSLSSSCISRPLISLLPLRLSMYCNISLRVSQYGCLASPSQYPSILLYL